MLRKDTLDLEVNGDVGDWAFTDDENYIEFWFFDEVENHRQLHILPISKVPRDTKHVYWMWDGNKEEPTFIPSPQSSLVSVRVLGPTPDKDRFHKSLVKGKWV